MVDIDAVDPLSGEPLYYETVEINGRKRIRYKNYQKVDTLALAAICLKNETKELLNAVFKDFYDFCNLLSTEGLPANGDDPALRPFKYESCADLCWNNKCVGSIGGACKVKDLFCIYCEASGNSNTDLMRYVTGDAICDICVYNQRTRCPHRAVNDAKEIKRKIGALTKLILEDHRKMKGDDTLELRDILPSEPVDVLVGYVHKQFQWEKVSLRDTISEDGTQSLAPEEYVRHIRHTEEVAASKTVMVYEPESLSKATDLNNVEFQLGGDALEDSEFHSNVRMDLRARGFNRANGMMPNSNEERRALLLSCLTTKLLVDINRRAIKREEESKYERFVGPGNAIPCRLHDHNRTAEKLAQQLFVCGMRMLLPGELPAFIEEIENVVNTLIFHRSMIHLESEDGYWRFPISKTDPNKLGDVSFDNDPAKAFTAGMHHIVPVCTRKYEPEVGANWLCAIEKFREYHKKADSHFKFEFHDVCSYQLSADEFFDYYIPLTGRDGQTNYFHNAFGGHNAWFLIEKDNLYKYAQQGWEHLNGGMKRKFHSNTQHGGGRGGSSKLLPVMQSQTRGMLWRHGHGDALFKSLGFGPSLNIKLGRKPTYPKYEKVSKLAIKEFANKILKLKLDDTPPSQSTSSRAVDGSGATAGTADESDDNMSITFEDCEGDVYNEGEV